MLNDKICKLREKLNESIINGEDYKFREGSYRVLFYKYKDYVIWGMTARILENFLNKIKNNLEK